MIVRLKDHTGASILLNTDKVVFVGQAAEKGTGRPMIGMSLAVMEGGAQMMLDGSPDQVYNRISGPEFVVSDNGLRGN